MWPGVENVRMPNIERVDRVLTRSVDGCGTRQGLYYTARSPATTLHTNELVSLGRLVG